jgi:hypothetical protein
MEKYLIQQFCHRLLSKSRQTPDEMEQRKKLVRGDQGPMSKKTPHGGPTSQASLLWVSPKKKGSSSNNPTGESESI